MMPEFICFNDRIVVVTGGARGIGKNIAVRFAEFGALVLIVDRDEPLAMETVEYINNKIGESAYICADLSQKEDCECLMEKISEMHGCPDVLINNARGGARTMPLQETSKNLEITLNISLYAPLLLSQSFINMRRVGKSSVLNISSVASQMVSGESIGYHVAKAGLESMTRYLAVASGSKGVRVNAIRPGFIVQDEHRARFNSPENKAYRKVSNECHPLSNVGSADHIADAALFLCSDRASFITGQTLTVDGGLTIQDQFSIASRFANI